MSMVKEPIILNESNKNNKRKNKKIASLSECITL